MQLNKFTIGKKSMDFAAVFNIKTSENKDAKEFRKVSAYEEPLPGLRRAFAALSPVLVATLDIRDPDYTDRVTVHGVTISRTKAGTRSIILHGKVQLDSRTEYLHPIESPMLQIDDNAEGESGEIQIRDEKHLKARPRSRRRRNKARISSPV